MAVAPDMTQDVTTIDTTGVTMTGKTQDATTDVMIEEVTTTLLSGLNTYP